MQAGFHPTDALCNRIANICSNIKVSSSQKVKMWLDLTKIEYHVNEGFYNVRSVKKDTKRSSNTLLHLVSFFTERTLLQSYEIKSPPWTILWFRILGIFSAENIKRLCVFMFQTRDKSQLLRRVLWISAELTIVSSFKHKYTQPLYFQQGKSPPSRQAEGGDLIT